MAQSVKILTDRNGVEWECVNDSPTRSSYVTYVCRRLDQADAPARRISAPAAWDLDDPQVAFTFLDQ